jgi:hypothetical protein
LALLGEVFPEGIAWKEALDHSLASVSLENLFLPFFGKSLIKGLRKFEKPRIIHS